MDGSIPSHLFTGLAMTLTCRKGMIMEKELMVIKLDTLVSAVPKVNCRLSKDYCDEDLNLGIASIISQCQDYLSIRVYICVDGIAIRVYGF